MRRFLLQRLRDVSGVSGTGMVAEGIEFSDGRCALMWRDHGAIAVYERGIEQIEAVHGHGGATIVAWLDGKEEADG